MSTLQTPRAWGRRGSAIPVKFVPPNLPSHWVRRDRLDRQLSLAVQHPLTIIAGPPGSGKSVLLAGWAHVWSNGVVSWLSVDETDDGLAPFWESAAAALRVAHRDEDVSIGRCAQAGSTQFVELLLQQAAGDQPRVLIVDNFHLITDETVIASVARLANRLPSNLRLVLAGQRAPVFPLRQLVTAGQAAMLDDGDLRFTVAECAALLALVAQKIIPIRDLEGLSERSEGWAAGLHLAALELMERNSADVAECCSGARGPVADYIDHEVLMRQPPDVVRFLLQTSVVEHLTIDLCRAVTGRNDAGEVLRALAVRNLFVVPTGSGEPEFRYHRLFADRLRSRLQLEDPAFTREAHLAAAGWFEQCGDTLSAAKHFAEAGAYERAVSLAFPDLVQHSDDRAQPEGTAFVTPRLSETCLEQAPGRMYLVAAALICAQRVAEAAEMFRRLDAVTADDTDRRLWRARAEFLWAVHADRLGDAVAVLDRCRAVKELMGPAQAPWLGPLRTFDPGSPWIERVDASISARLPLLAARAHVWLGLLDEARAILAETFASEDRAEAAQAGTLAVIASLQGRLRNAYRLGSAALQGAEVKGRAGDLVALDARLALAEVLFEHNELEEAQEHLEAARRLCRSEGMAPWTWAVEADLVHVMTAQERTGDALNRLGQLRQLALRDPPPHHLLQKLNQIEIDCRLSLGDLEGALVVARSVHPGDIPCETLARVDLCSGRPDSALARLTASRSPTLPNEIRRLVLLARTEAQHGDVLRALDTLRRAVEAGRPEGYVRPFLEEAPQVLPLLRVIFASRPEPYLAQLIAQTERAVPSTASNEPRSVMEPLTTRERQVLGYLPSHLSGPDIAARIYVSPNTVKTHLKAIYRKIGAASRAEAVVIAVSRGLLQEPAVSHHSIGSWGPNFGADGSVSGGGASRWLQGGRVRPPEAGLGGAR